MLEKVKAFFSQNKLNESGREGVQKYLNGKSIAGLGGALFLIVICVIIAVAASMTTESCARSGLTGTWVLREDYVNGFDQGDMYVEFRKDGSFFVNGSHKGYLVIDGKKRGISTVPNVSYLNSSADRVRTENNKLIIEAKSNRLFNFDSPDAWRLQVYIRISGNCELTPEQRSELY